MAPKYTISVVSSDRLTVQEDNSQLLSVLFEIRSGDEVVKAMRHGFPLEATPADIELELANVLVTFMADEQLAINNADNDRLTANADETIDAIKDLTFTSDEAEKVMTDAAVDQESIKQE